MLILLRGDQSQPILGLAGRLVLSGATLITFFNHALGYPLCSQRILDKVPQLV